MYINMNNTDEWNDHEQERIKEYKRLKKNISSKKYRKVHKDRVNKRKCELYKQNKEHIIEMNELRLKRRRLINKEIKFKYLSDVDVDVDVTTDNNLGLSDIFKNNTITILY